MMRAASREAVVALGNVRDGIVGTGASTQQLTTLADELYSVAGLLVAQPRLRRALAAPATEPEGRSALAGDLLNGRLSAQAVQIVQAAVAQRWSSPWDLTDALERVGDDSLLAAAESENALDEVEDQLFRFERVLDGAGDLAALLDERTATASRRIELLNGVLAGKVHPITLQLLQHAVASDRKRSLHLAIDDLLDSAAARRERSIARVTSAVELSEAQQQRLAALLSEMYSRPIDVRTALDPALRGGLVIRVGDEIIDGSIATRIVQARNALAG